MGVFASVAILILLLGLGYKITRAILGILSIILGSILLLSIVLMGLNALNIMGIPMILVGAVLFRF